MLRDLIIVGSSGLAKEIYFLLKSINSKNNQWNILGFADLPEKIGSAIQDRKVLFSDEMLLGLQSETNIVLGLGFPDLVARVSKKLKQNPFLRFPNIIDPSVIADWESISLGEGNIFTAGNILTTDIKIGSFNLFNLNGTVGHDTNIGSFNIFNPTYNISGNVIIRDQVLLGTGAQILQQLEITSNSIIGAGSVVTKNISEPGVYVGSPAKFLKPIK